MKVGHQQVDGAKAIPRRDEDVGRPGERSDQPIFAGRAFQQAQRRRADGHHPAPTLANGVERVCGLRRDVTDFGMHLVVLGIVHLHGKEGAGADMQRHEMPVDTACRETVQELRGEMQPGRRRGDGPALTCIDGLVVRPIMLVLGPARCDIGRQWNVADRYQRQVEIRSGAIKGQGNLSVPALLRNDRAQRRCVRIRAGEHHAVARTQLARTFDERLPAIGSLAHVQCGRQPNGLGTVAIATPLELGRDDLGVVEYQRVARPQKIGKIARMPVLERLARLHHEKA